MNPSEYYRCHITPREDISHSTGVWVNALLEVDPSIQGTPHPSAHQIAVASAHKIYGDVPLSITMHSLTLDDFEKILKKCDYHIVASALYHEGSVTPIMNLALHSPLNGGTGVKIGVSSTAGEYEVYPIKEFWAIRRDVLSNCTIITIKDQ